MSLGMALGAERLAGRQYDAPLSRVWPILRLAGAWLLTEVREIEAAVCTRL